MSIEVVIAAIAVAFTIAYTIDRVRVAREERRVAKEAEEYWATVVAAIERRYGNK